MDEYGIYGIKDDANFNATTEETGAKAIQKIKDNATYSLTWDGFTLKAADDSGRFEIDSNKDLMIIEEPETEDPITRIHLGRLKDGDKTNYGMQILGRQGGTVLVGDIGEIEKEDKTKKALVISAGD
jgi:glycosidase